MKRTPALIGILGAALLTAMPALLLARAKGSIELHPPAGVTAESRDWRSGAQLGAPAVRTAALSPAPSQYCVSRTVISSGLMVFVVHGIGRTTGSACLPSTQHTQVITDCLRQTAPRMSSATAIGTISTAPLQECLQRRLPGSAVAGSVLGSSSRGSVGLIFTDHSGSYGGSPTCGGSVDPRRAAGGWFRDVIRPAYDNYSKGKDAVDYAEKGAVVFAGFKTALDRNRYMEEVLQQAGSSDGVTAQEGEAAEQVKRSAATATFLANENLDIPEKNEKGLLDRLKDWVSSWFSVDDESTEDAGGSRADPRAEDPCASVASFIASCAQSPRTGPCQLFYTRLRNPRCDPLVALTAEGKACAGREYTDAEVRVAIQRAELKCWSLVRPTPDGGGAVCGVRFPDGGSAFLAVPDAASSACSSPVSLTTEDQCAPKLRSPAEVAADLLPDRYSVIDLVLGMQGGLPPLPAGPRPR